MGQYKHPHDGIVELSEIYILLKIKIIWINNVSMDYTAISLIFDWNITRMQN